MTDSMHVTDSAVYGSSLYAATMATRHEYARLTLDLDVDICVIGGGLAGLTVARELAQHGRSVALLEARRIAWNASGRNTGFVLPGFAQAADQIVERVGAKRARELWALSEAGLDYVRRTIRDTAMPGVTPADGWLAVCKTDRKGAILDEADLLRETLGADIEFWPTDMVRDRLRTPIYFQAIHYPHAFHIHPLNYAFGLAKAAEQAGARIFEETPALSIDPAGVRKRITTPAARVRAAHIVLAGNVHLGALMPEISRTLLPVTTYVIATAPLGDRLADAIAYRGAVSDTEWADNHYRTTQDNRLIWSGRMTTWQSNPTRYVKSLRADIARIYPQLGEVEIEYAWNGTLGNTMHRMPQIGEVSPGLWLASGFGGHGLNTTAMAGTLIARAIAEGDKTWQLFSPYELVWAGGMPGRIVAQAAYWGFRLKERITARMSRRREAARSRGSGTPVGLQESKAARSAHDLPAHADMDASRTGPASSVPS